MRADLAADAVFQRRDDLAARRIVFRIRREHQHHIQRQADRIALNLHVAFLHDVEQAHLDLARQIGQFVDGENPAIGARQQAVVDRQFVGDIVPAARRLDRIDVADHVGDGHVRRGQLLHVALLRMQPRDRRVRRPSRAPDRGSAGRSDDTDCRGSRSPRCRASCGSSSVVSMRIRRVLACPRKPSRMKLCFERTAFTTWGTTVSS